MINNYCVTSNLGSATRINGTGALTLSNAYGINISDEGLHNVYVVYVAEVVKAIQMEEKK